MRTTGTLIVSVKLGGSATTSIFSDGKTHHTTVVVVATISIYPECALLCTRLSLPMYVLARAEATKQQLGPTSARFGAGHFTAQ